MVEDNNYEEETIRDSNIRVNPVASNLERLENSKRRRGRTLTKNKIVDVFIEFLKIMKLHEKINTFRIILRSAFILLFVFLGSGSGTGVAS